VAGLVIHESQTIPEEKQAFTFHGKRFIVMKRDRNRITRLRIRPMDKLLEQGCFKSFGIRHGQDPPSYQRVGSPGADASTAMACSPPSSSSLSKFVDRPVAFDAAHAGKRPGDDADPKMGFTGSVKCLMVIAAGMVMTGVEMAFVDHLEPFGG
jgi:hypothetical protein